MQIVIVGYGRVGIRTARILHEEGHDLVIVDDDAAKVERARKAGYEVVAGDGGEEDALDEAGVANADALGALTGDVNTNFAACMIANHYDCRTVLRIDDDYQEDIYDTYAEDVDEIIYPERLGAAGAKTALLGGNFDVIADLTETLSLTVIHVPEDSPVVGERVVSLDLGEDARIYAHGARTDPMTIPLPSTSIAAGDRLAVIAEQDQLENVRASLVGA
jgi:trk system potassium uptake protein TrkA